MKDPCSPFPRPRCHSLFFLPLLLFLGLSMHSLTITTRPNFLHPFLTPGTNVVSSSYQFNSTIFNHTILTFAQIDLGEMRMANDASIMLDDVWKRSLTQSFWDLFGKGDITSRLEAVRLKYARAGVRLPIQLTRSKYVPYWPQFRKSLQKWVEGKSYDARIISLLVHSVKDPIDRHYGKNGRSIGKELVKYKTCAVVGNSGILLNRNHGSLIDAHDMVMRLNNARTAGFERQVGCKTTISFINSNILQACARSDRCSCRPYGPNVPTVLYICQVVHFMDVVFCSALDQSTIMVTDPRLDVLCTRIVKYYSIRNFLETTGKSPEEWSDTHDGPTFHYSSGMQAIVLALGICEEVSIFGFGKSPAAKHHYHTDQREELHLHDYEAEYQFYHDLAHNRSSFIPFLSDSGYSLPIVQIYT